jgi:hypothetical protein
MELGMVVGGVLGVIAALFRSRAALVAVAVIGVIVVGLGIVAASRPEPTPAEIEAAFVSGCHKGCARAGAPADLCSIRCDCMVRKLQERRSPEEFAQFIHAVGSDAAPALRSEIERTAQACQTAR